MSTGTMSGQVACPVCNTRHLPFQGQIKDGVYAATCECCGHFFKFKASLPVRSEIQITINGQEYTVGNNYNAATSLNEFLREKRISTGTKYMCREGGCGLCVVMVTTYEPLRKKKESWATNSCLCPLYMCDGIEITTIEGIGSLQKGLHPIQSRLDKYNGSQCGFCSPAQIMNMYALLKKTSEPCKQTIEDSFDGILCRCTGYRSILDAMKSFSDDDKCSTTDIEDLNIKLCNTTGKPCTGKCNKNDLPRRPVHMVLDEAQWFKPTSLQQLYDLLNQYKGKSVRLVFGNTGSGVFKDIGPWMYDILIDLHDVEELFHFTVTPQFLIGSNISLSQMIEIFSDDDIKDPKLPYIKECAAFLKRIAHTIVRNAGSWAGNLMLKHKHPEFPSDLFVMLETLNTEVYINGNIKVSPQQLLSTDMTGKVLTHIVLPAVDDYTITKFYKVAKRSQNSHSYVSGGFKFSVDKSNNFHINGKPSIVYAGINKTFVHAVKTEDFLTDRDLSAMAVISGISVLKDELNPDNDPLAGSAKFRSDLAVCMFYRFVVHVLGKEITDRYRSGGYPLHRPLSSGQQSYGTKKDEWPLTEPLLKLEGSAQVTGEAVYINDIPSQPGELYAAFTVTNVGNAKISNIDISPAMKMKGVVKVLLAEDIPGINNAMPSPFVAEEVLCSGQVMYAGQPVAIVVADNEETAYSAARSINITYTDIKPPVLTIQEAIEKQMIFPNVAEDIIVGNAEDAISKSAHVITGSIQCGTQYHFSMETQISICIPTEDGMKVYASSQWIDYAQKSIAQVVGMPCASIDLEVKRLGGAYGSKISRNFGIASACAVAAKVLNRPVRLALNFHTNMEMVGKRFPYLAKYQVGVTDEGKLNGIKVTYYCDCGYTVNDCTVGDIMYMGDNAYYCPNWHMIPVAVQTNTPSNSYCRAPASTPGIFIMETIIEHIGNTLGKLPEDIKQLNLYKKGQITPGGMTLTYCSVSDLMNQLEDTAEVAKRQADIDTFNNANRWKKRGLSVVPLKYGVPWNTQNYGVNISIYSQDGTVSLSHGGIEVGQGINTKAAQVCAFEFGIPVTMVKIKPTNTFTSAGSCFTGSSVTSELVCQSVINACKKLNDRMAPVKSKMVDPDWLKIVQECYNEGIDLATHSWYKPHSDGHYKYNSYGVTCTEVELDVLTGEHEITRVDILFDCGESINPFLDIGQVEGAFVMGIGYWLLEESIYDQNTGKYLTNGTWDYKPPSSKDIPIDFRIKLLKDAPNPLGILRSKASGEPPFCMSCSVLFALKHAVEAARKESGKDAYFALDGPATVEVLQGACMTDLESLQLY
ncbi:hypothetical protein ACF0H5_015539 [Mactra antiquata]